MLLSINQQTHKWRKLYRNKGVAVPGDNNKPKNRSAGDKLAVVFETASFNEVELKSIKD